MRLCSHTRRLASCSTPCAEVSWVVQRTTGSHQTSVRNPGRSRARQWSKARSHASSHLTAAQAQSSVLHATFPQRHRGPHANGPAPQPRHPFRVPARCWPRFPRARSAVHCATLAFISSEPADERDGAGARTVRPCSGIAVAPAPKRHPERPPQRPLLVEAPPCVGIGCHRGVYGHRVRIFAGALRF